MIAVVSMSKRSSGTFERKPRDWYPTPLAAVAALIPHLPTTLFRYCEPCAGDGALIQHLATLASHALCVGAYDIEPQVSHVERANALSFTHAFDGMFITNPPWDRPILHQLITHLSDLAPTWLLLDADWMHTKQSAPYMSRCVKIASVGRVKWIPDSTMVGKDNCVWMKFWGGFTGRTEFVGRY